MSSDLSSIQSQFKLNSVKSNPESVYEFEDFRLDATHLMLYRDDERTNLAPKVVETLLALVERGGEIVSKEEMMERLWKNSFVEESNLTQNIYLLRKTLGKGADGRDLIETFRRRGYRFTGAIKSRAENLQAEKTEEPAQPTAALEKSEQPNAFDSLAVLPFKNESSDETAEYLSDGVTESIINRLSQLEDFRVVARNTVFRYKNAEIDQQKIGRDLSVSAILTGRILQFGEKLIVRTELTDTASGWQIWGEQYDRLSSDVLELQETIARDISDKLELKLSREEKRRISKRDTESSEAYDAYVKGRYFWNKRQTETIEQATVYFQKAIELDSSYALAYVGLADCYPLLSLYGRLTPREAYPKAETAARKALEIDDRLAEAYNSFGVVKLFYEWDWAGAESAFQKAIALNPNYADAHQRYGMFLTARGRFDEAIGEFEKAIRLDPLSLIIKTISGYPFYYARRFEEAAKRFGEVIAADENYSMAHFRLGLTRAQLGEFEKAIAEFEKSIELSNDRDSIAAVAYVQGLAGNSEKAVEALAELDEREKKGFVTSYNRALIEIGLGNYESALDWLEKAFEEHSYWLIYLKVDPALDALRKNPRFAALQEKIFGAESRNETIETPGLFAAARQAVSVEKRFSGKRTWAAAVVFGLLLLAVFGLTLIDWNEKSDAEQSARTPNITLKRLTPDINVIYSEFTPDGKSLIYTQLEKGEHSVWLKDLATGSATQILPPTKNAYRHPRFSRDGAMIYYITNRPDKPNGTLVRAAIMGGTPEEIVTNLISPVAFSPDERQISFINGDDVQLHIAKTDGTDERILAKRDPKKGWFESWGSQMSWSPDGEKIAICGGRFGEGGKKIYELIEINTRDGSEKIIPTPAWNYLDDAVWLNDQTGLIVLARETEASPFQLWHVSYPDGATRKITNDTNGYGDIALSPDSRRLVTNQEFLNFNLWLAPLDDLAKARQITFGSRSADGYYGIAFTPDGKIIYTSPRDGNLDLWMINADGSSQKQLTKNAGDVNIKPQVTADGRYIVFVSSRTGARQIWRMDADGGNPKQLTDILEAGDLSLSPDGNWIYFSTYDDKWSVAKISIDGGEIMRVSKTLNSVGYALVSPDGKLIFCNTYEVGSANPWKKVLMSAETGLQIQTLPDEPQRVAWAADSKSIIYNLNNNLFQTTLDGSEKKQLTNYESGHLRWFAVSHDYRQIAMSRGNSSSEAVLIENFRNVINTSDH